MAAAIAAAALLASPAARFAPTEAAARSLAPDRTPTMFVNPICADAADPWMVYWKGAYYLTATRGDRVSIRRSPTLAGLHDAPEVTVWRGGGAGYEGYTRDIWAPELHYLNGKW